MNNTEPLQVLRDAIAQLESNGQHVLRAAAVREALDRIMSGAANVKRAEEELWKREGLAFSENMAHFRQNQSDVISFGQLALKSLITMNAGACVAILAYAGQPTLDATIRQRMLPALSWLLAGAFFAVAATGAAYLSQMHFAYGYEAAIDEDEPRKTRRHRLGRLFWWLVVAFEVLALCGFVIGCWAGARSLG